MEFDAVLLPARRDAMIEQGLWHDRTINQDLDACVAACPDKLALTAYRVEADDVRRFTYRELAQMTDRVAVGLTRLGVQKRHRGLSVAQLVAVHGDLSGVFAHRCGHQPTDAHLP